MKELRTKKISNIEYRTSNYDFRSKDINILNRHSLIGVLKSKK